MQRPIFDTNFHAPWYNLLNHVDSMSNNSFQEGQVPIAALLNGCLDNVNATNLATIVNAQKLPIRFVSQHCLPAGEAYESFIAKTGQIPTRDNAHDLLNGLIWLNFPTAKALFNQLHAQDIIRHGINAARTPLRNALTLFDENGGIVVSANRDLLEALQHFNWQDVFVDARDHWGEQHRDIAFFPFGHALLEKLISPRKNITSHTLLIEVDAAWLSQPLKAQRQQLDIAVSTIFQQTVNNKADDKGLSITSKNFQPLPVMGIPDYCQENLQAEFYQDNTVFRLPRAIKAPIYNLTS